MDAQKPTALSESLAGDIAREAFWYAYPLMLMDVTRRQMTNFAEPPGAPGAGPPNRFVHVREFPDPNFRVVVRPNLDTLYSIAWLDLAAEPLVLSVPAIDRYFMLPVLTMWTDVFAAPGTRTTGSGVARQFAVFGPQFKGEIPGDLDPIRSPTRYAWVIGRTQTNGKADYENVHRIQDQFAITPLSAWGKPGHVAARGVVDPSVDIKTPPPLQLEKLDAAAFFARFVTLMKDNPPYFYDYPELHRLGRLGIRPGKDFVLARQPQLIQVALGQALRAGFALLKNTVGEAGGRKAGTWVYLPRGGLYSNEYRKRALIAQAGLGMNLEGDAIYPMLTEDAEGKPLTGTHDYVVTFRKGETPPVDAFWSITVYDAEGYLHPNPIERCALGDRDPLQREPDGSIKIYVSSGSPGKDREANWLPVPQGPFNLTLRMYSPRPAILDGTWTPPPAERVR
jgi:hypothetical protein